MSGAHPARSECIAGALLVVPPLAWAGNFVVGRLVRDAITPLELSFARWSIALLVLLPFTARAVWRQRAVVAGSWKLMLLLGATGIGGFHFLVYLALQSTGAINAGLIMSLTPVLIVALSFLLFRERVTSRQAAGIAVSLTGAVVLVLRGEPATLTALSFNPGDAWMLAAVPLWAFYSTVLRRKPAEMRPLVLLTVTIALGLAVLTPFMAVRAAAGAVSAMSVEAWGAIVYVALFASVIAYVCWNKGIATLGANRGGLFIHLLPVFSAVLAVVVLDEALRPYHLAGAALVFCGIWLTTVTPRATPPPLPLSRGRGPG